MSTNAITIRHAKATDAVKMHAIITYWAERERMLHRSLAEMYENLRDFMVAEENGEVIGLSGLRVMWSNLAENYSLAIDVEARGKGLGKMLVKASVDQAKELGIRQVFALTYEQAFFESCGFEVVDRQDLPMKVWSECSRCPKRLDCDEIAVVYINKDVPDIESPEAMNASMPLYQVPVVSKRLKLPSDQQP